MGKKILKVDLNFPQTEPTEEDKTEQLLDEYADIKEEIAINEPPTEPPPTKPQPKRKPPAKKAYTTEELLEKKNQK